MNINISGLVPNPTRPNQSELDDLKKIAKDLPPVTEAKQVTMSGAKLIKQGFKEFNDGTVIQKGIRYKFTMMLPIDHYPYMLKLFKAFGTSGAQAYVEFVKQIYEKKLEVIDVISQLPDKTE